MEKVEFTEARETMLATLYGRALDARSARPILGDDAAVAAVDRIDYDFRKPKMNAMTAAGVAMRALQLDTWAKEYLATQPSATVLHLACGMDTRVYRVDPSPDAHWYDVDFPDVIELRRRLLPDRPGYHTIGTSVTDADWLEQVPSDQPGLVVAEGLTMYLTEEQGRQLVERVTSHFPTGQLVFDAYSKRAIRMQSRVPAVKNSGATLHWGIDRPRQLESWHDGLTCLTAKSSWDAPGWEKLPAHLRLPMRAMAHLPGFRHIGWLLRYQF